MWVTKEHKRNGYPIRKAAVVGEGWGGGKGLGGILTFLPGSLLGTWGLRRWSSSTQVSYSAGPSVQLGSGPNSLTVCLSGERYRRHKVTVAQMPTSETKYSSQAWYCCCYFTEELAISLSACFNAGCMQLFAWLNMIKSSKDMQTLMHVSFFFLFIRWNMKSERGETETPETFRHKSTSHISTLTQTGFIPPLQKHGNRGPTAGSTVIASTPAESALLASDFNSLHPSGRSTAEGE